MLVAKTGQIILEQKDNLLAAKVMYFCFQQLKKITINRLHLQVRAGSFFRCK